MIAVMKNPFAILFIAFPPCVSLQCAAVLKLHAKQGMQDTDALNQGKSRPADGFTDPIDGEVAISVIN